jgi:transcriptional regulator with XRE-family HTH domain
MRGRLIDVMAIGRRLADVRADAGMSQKTFSQKSGFSISAVKNYERGARPPSAEYLAYSCLAFGVSADWLLLGNSIRAHETPEDEAA